MKKYLIVSLLTILTYVLFCSTNICVAVDESVDANSSSVTETEYKMKTASDYDLNLKKHSFEIGPEAYSYTYKEPDPDIKFTGVFYGGALSYTFRGWVPDSPDEPLQERKVPLRVEFRYATGNADYDGYLSNGTPHDVDGVDFDAYETRALVGIDSLDEGYIASLYTGVGYRYSTDNMSFDPYGYKRESNYIYIPIMYQIDSKFVHNWSFGCNLEVDILTWGEQYSHLADVEGSDYRDVKNRQKSGCGLRGALRIQNKTQAGVLLIEPFIRYWNIRDSELEYVSPSFGYGLEPENNTTEVGIQLMWKM